MQLVEQSEATEGRPIAVGPSVAVELSWVLLAGSVERLRMDNPELSSLYENQSILARVQHFWPEDVGDFGELLVLADAAQALGATEIDELLAGIGHMATRTLGSLPLATESSGDRMVFLSRLDRLRASPRLRHRYANLLVELWEGVGPGWAGRGQPLVEAAAERYRDRLEQGAGWADLVVSDSEHLAAILPRLIGRLPPGGPVRIAPSYFSGQGLLFDLPGGILVGVRAAAPGTDAGARRRTAGLANRLKALAEPTRLAIVDMLAQRPSTVGEIARQFGLAQPTVSNHVRLLRDAGIVSDRRNGSRRELVLQRSQAVHLVGELQQIVGGASPDPGAAPGPQ